jgi:hypothetical protein
MARTTGCKTLASTCTLHLHLHPSPTPAPFTYTCTFHLPPAPAPVTCTLHLHLDTPLPRRLSSMRNFWALPAVLRIALANQHAFSVFDDLLAFPQVGCALRGVWCGMRC